jgi:2-(1,2-epoxy-1,2-dihydrophenyl)acetyl-CoA isomerase
MSAPPVLFAIDGAIATLTLNRPASGNAVDLWMAQALRDAADRCDMDPAIRCVVLTGQGKLFCGGGDIAGFAAAADRVPAFLNTLAGTLHLALSRLMRMRKPLVTLVNGPAAGAGLSLAITGDIVLAARSAHFTAAYGSIGLSPDGGMSWHLPRLVGMRRAQEMIIGNRRVSAYEAERIGLVTRTVADADLAIEGAAQAAWLAAAPTAAIGEARNLLLDSYDGPFERQLGRETRSITASGDTAECREGVRAFLEKRKPDFTNAAG